MTKATSYQFDGVVDCATCVAYLDDRGGSHLLAAAALRVAIFLIEADTGEIKRLNGEESAKPFDSPVSALAFDARARRLAVGFENGTIKIFDRATGAYVCKAFSHRTKITHLEFHPIGDFLVSSSCDTHVRVWDLRKESCLQVYKHRDAIATPITIVRAALDGVWAVSGTESGAVHIYDLKLGKLSKTIEHHKAPITSLSLHPSYRSFAAASSDGTLSMWDMDTYQLMFSLPDTGCTVIALAPTTCYGFGPNVIKTWSLPKCLAKPATEVTLGTIIHHATNDGHRVHVVGSNHNVVNLCTIGPADAAPAVESQPRRGPVPRTTHLAHPVAPVPPTLVNAMSSPTVAKEAIQPTPQAQAPISPRAPRVPPAINRSVECAEIDEFCRRSDTMQTHMRRRAVQLRRMTGCFVHSAGEAFQFAKQLVTDKETQDSGAVVAMLDRVARDEALREQIRLDHVPDVLGVVDAVLERHSQQPDFTSTCLSLATVLLIRHQDRIVEVSRGAALRGPGTDIALDERARVCAAAKKSFAAVRARAMPLVTKPDDSGTRAQEFIAAYAQSGL